MPNQIHFFESSINGLKKANSLSRLIESWGQPDAKSTNKKPPFIYRYGFIDVTIYMQEIIGVRIDCEAFDYKGEDLTIAKRVGKYNDYKQFAGLGTPAKRLKWRATKPVLNFS